jgi:hypothetical protein
VTDGAMLGGFMVLRFDLGTALPLAESRTT